MNTRSQEKSEGAVSKDLLQHAAWHCLFGSAALQREPERADVDAAKILNDLRDAAKAEGDHDH